MWKVEMASAYSSVLEHQIEPIAEVLGRKSLAQYNPDSQKV